MQSSIPQADSLAALLAELGIAGPFLDLNDLTTNLTTEPSSPFHRIPRESLDAAVQNAGKPFGLLQDGSDGAISPLFHTADGTCFTIRSAAFRDSRIIVTLETPGSDSQFTLSGHSVSELRRMLIR